MHQQQQKASNTKGEVTIRLFSTHIVHALAELQLQLQRKLFLSLPPFCAFRDGRHRVAVRCRRTVAAAAAAAAAALLVFLALILPLGRLAAAAGPRTCPCFVRCSLLPEDLRLELGVEEAELGDDVGGPAQEVLPVPEHDGDLIGEEEPLAEAEL